MNVNMWEHPATQANLEILRQRGVHIIEPGSGYPPAAWWVQAGWPTPNTSWPRLWRAWA